MQGKESKDAFRMESQDDPLGYVFVSETYRVTWKVPEDEATEFVQDRKSKKDEFAKQHQKEMKGETKAEKVEQTVEKQQKGAELDEA